MQPADNTWRLLDTGLRPAAQNIAINKALLSAHQRGDSPNTLRFLRYEPSALLGYHQSAEQELQLDYCRTHAIQIQRRITGGGAIYFDPGQIGWELYVNKDFFAGARMDDVAAQICRAAAAGIRSLGVDAQFRPRNDIEVHGKKISGTGGTFDGSSLLYQGTLLIEFDVERMLRVLRIPMEKLSDKAIQSARDRVTDLATLLGRAPAQESVSAALMAAFERELHIRIEPATGFNAAEQVLYAEALQEVDSLEWINLVQAPRHDTAAVSVVHRCAGGTLRVSILLDTFTQRLKQTWINGDFFATPKRCIADLEAHLKNIRVSELEQAVFTFFNSEDIELLQMSALDFLTAIQLAVTNAQAQAHDRQGAAVGEAALE